MGKPRRYAEGTSVPVEKTKTELDALLQKHGANQRLFAQDDERQRAIIKFAVSGRQVALQLRVSTEGLPDPGNSSSSDAPQGWRGWPVSRRQDWRARKLAQRERETWRRLLLLTKSKLEAIAEGLSTYEREFLPDIVLPDGSTVYEMLGPQLELSYGNGKMPPLLPPPGGTQ